MIRALFQVQRKRSITELKLLDEEEAMCGFVTYVDLDEGTFDIYVADSVFSDVIIGEHNGMVMVESKEDADAIDYTMLKVTRNIDSVYSVAHDVRHAFPLERMKWLDSQRKFVYDQAAADFIEEQEILDAAMSAAEAEQKKSKPKFTNVIKKDKDKETIVEINNDGAK